MTLVDIRDAVIQKLSTGFPGFYLYEDALPQDFSRPCFLTGILSATKINENPYRFSKTVTVKVTYYSDGDAGNGVLEMQDRLEGVFDLVLQAGDRAIGLDGTKGEIIDKVLYFTFDLSYADGREAADDSHEMMQTLEMKEEF